MAQHLLFLLLTLITSLSWVQSNPIPLQSHLVKPLLGYYFGSTTPFGSSSSYNYCNMPHVNINTYQAPTSEYELKYVEVIQRHHLRTPYESNLLPIDVKEQGIKYPQITEQGERDSFEHGRDLFTVYHGLVGLIGDEHDEEQVGFRVTNNDITTQVFNQLIIGFFPNSYHAITPELRTDKDTLEPNIPCDKFTDLLKEIRSDPEWKEEINLDIYSQLSEITGISKSDDPKYASFFQSIDHFFDNLSTKTCSASSSSSDLPPQLTSSQLETVIKLGNWEYDFTYFHHPHSLQLGILRYAPFLAELNQRFQSIIDGKSNSNSKKKYQHNIAHDGSISALTAALKDYLDITVFKWPGMGAEYVFELYLKKDKNAREEEKEKEEEKEWWLRVIYAGEVVKFGNIDEFRDYLSDTVKIQELTCGV